MWSSAYLFKFTVHQILAELCPLKISVNFSFPADSSSSWSARKSYLKSLDTIHHQGLRLALGAFRTSPIESLYAESNEPSLYIRREKLSLQYVTKLAANPRNSAYVFLILNTKDFTTINQRLLNPLVWEYNRYLKRPILILKMFSIFLFHQKSHGR